MSLVNLPVPFRPLRQRDGASALHKFGNELAELAVTRLGSRTRPPYALHGGSRPRVSGWLLRSFVGPLPRSPSKSTRAAHKSVPAARRTLNLGLKIELTSPLLLLNCSIWLAAGTNLRAARVSDSYKVL
jgi:hypothetical protein